MSRYGLGEGRGFNFIPLQLLAPVLSSKLGILGGSLLSLPFSFMMILLFLTEIFISLPSGVTRRLCWFVMVTAIENIAIKPTVSNCNSSGI